MFGHIRMLTLMCHVANTMIHGMNIVLGGDISTSLGCEILSFLILQEQYTTFPLILERGAYEYHDTN